MALRVVGPRDVSAAAGHLIAPRVLSDDIAYVMYTSGSTGRPKGIVHTHRSGLRYAQQAVELYGVQPWDRLANSAPFHFDISTFELFAGPLAGASTLVIPEPYLKLPASLSQLLADDRPRSGTRFLPPRRTAGPGCARLSRPACAAVGAVRGEVMPPEVLARLVAHLPSARFSNSYGPAEVNQCTYHHLDGPPADRGSLPIGQPLPDAELLVTDEAGQEDHGVRSASCSCGARR